MVIVRTLCEQSRKGESERACGTFPVDVAPSTLTHHFRVLREADVIRQAAS
jgi:DNA-binding transcriptional ArsR family regulator